MARTHTQLTPEVEGVLRASSITDRSLTLPPGMLDRKLYEAVNKVLVNAGGKWNRSAKAHLFPSDPRERLGLVLETGVSVNEKQLYQVFYTPADIAARLAMLGSVGGRTVLEPSAGEGALADACKRAGAVVVHCIEVRPTAAEVLRGKGYLVDVADFLTVGPVRTPFYDRVIMNPPFTRGQDLKHVRHALKFMRPDAGTLVSVVAGWEAPDLAGLSHHERLPEGAFEEAGTGVRTSIIVVEA